MSAPSLHRESTDSLIAYNEKESLHVEIKESNCVNFAVGCFN